MSEEQRCTQCQKALPINAPSGLCPACLMQMAMKSDTMLSASPDGAYSVSHLQNPTLEQPRESQDELALTMSRAGSTSTVATPDFPPGTELGSFTLDRKLGEGGMGAVYEAFDAESKRRVAVKILKHKLNTPEARKRFLREGRTAASINHPNSVYVYGTDNIDGKLVISMELLGRGNLQDVVRRHGPLGYRQAVDTILQVIDGLEAAAKVGVLHRDIKPSNCFIDSDGSVKVGDFGLSISTEAVEDSMITGEKTFLGTPAFSSPEQLRGDDLDLRADIYSLGVTLFFLLTGETPFKAKGFVQLLATVLEQAAPSVTTLQKDVPRKLSESIQRCLAKMPQERWGDYDQLRQALLPYSSQAVVPASLASRFLANVADLVPLQMVGMVIGLIAAPHYGSRVVRVGVLFGTYFLAAFYYSACESWRGQTIGKALLGIRLEDEERNSPSFRQAFMRAAIFTMTASAVALPASLLMPPRLLATFWGVCVGLAWPILRAATLPQLDGQTGSPGSTTC